MNPRKKWFLTSRMRFERHDDTPWRMENKGRLCRDTCRHSIHVTLVEVPAPATPYLRERRMSQHFVCESRIIPTMTMREMDLSEFICTLPCDLR
jgi:hypothetical protein